MEGARKAERADIPRLADLFRIALDELTPTRGGAVFAVREARSEPVEVSFEESFDDGASALWAGTIDDVIVGYASARNERLRDGSSLAVVEDLFVEAGARSVGVGEALITEVLAWAADQGCAGVDATALPGNRATKNFFEGSGFSARLIVMHRRLS